MSVTLTIHDIGRASDPAATTVSTHVDRAAALNTLFTMYRRDAVRGDDRGGTIGSLTGRVFQASKTWRIYDG